MYRDKVVGQKAAGDLPINYKQLLAYQTGEDQLLRGILDDVTKGKPISFQDEMYLRQRAMEQMAFIRSNQENLKFGQRLRSRIPILRKPYKSTDALSPMEASKPLQTADVIQVTPGSEFQQATAVPRSRRSEVGRTIRALTPRMMRDGLKKGVEFMKGGRQISAVGEPLDNAMELVDTRMTEAVTSLERSTPLSATRMRKQGLSDSEALDSMFAFGMNGDDYTRVLELDGAALKKVAEQQRTQLATRLDAQGVIPSENVIANNFYSQLLGSAYNDPATIAALNKATVEVGGITQGRQLLQEDNIIKILNKMEELYPPSTSNLAVKNPFSRQADIAGVKIAMAADATRGTRMIRVAQEMGTQLPVETIQRIDVLAKQRGYDTDLYRNILSDHVAELIANGNMMDDITATRILDKHGIKVDGRRGPVGTLNNITGAPAQQQVNALYARKARMQAKGISEDIINTSVIQPAIKELGGDALRFQDPKGVLARIGLGGKAQGEIVTNNLTALRRIDPSLVNSAIDRLAYVASPKARLVSGQLGGMAVPNGIYHAENFVTAPLITAITDPDYLGTVIAQQARFLTGGFVEPSAVVRGGAGGVKDVIDARKISVAGGIVAHENPATGILRYTGANGKVGIYTPEEALYHYRQQNVGNTKQSLTLGENFVRDVDNQIKYGAKWNKKGAKEYAGQVAEEVKRSFLPGSGSTWGMRLADDTDRMFREAIFFEALKRGNTPDEAGRLAREVLLDYGSMPQYLKEGIMQYAMYQSFQYVMAAETIKACT